MSATSGPNSSRIQPNLSEQTSACVSRLCAILVQEQQSWSPQRARAAAKRSPTAVLATWPLRSQPTLLVGCVNLCRTSSRTMRATPRIPAPMVRMQGLPTAICSIALGHQSAGQPTPIARRVAPRLPVQSVRAERLVTSNIPLLLGKIRKMDAERCSRNSVHATRGFFLVAMSCRS